MIKDDDYAALIEEADHRERAAARAAVSAWDLLTRIWRARQARLDRPAAIWAPEEEGAYVRYLCSMLDVGAPLPIEAPDGTAYGY